MERLILAARGMPDDGLQLAARGLVFGLPAALEQHRSRRFVRFCVTPLTRTVGGEILRPHEFILTWNLER
jgi:hypothetical protein